MARFGPRADGPPIFGPGQAGPIYKRRIGPKWADGPSQAPEKPGRAKTGRATARRKTKDDTFLGSEFSRENVRIFT